MNKADAAGLAIKTRYLGEVSEEVIRLADRLDLPLIEIPKEIPFVEITMPLMKAIADEHNHNMEFSQRLNQKFLELELNNGGFDSIARTLAKENLHQLICDHLLSQFNPCAVMIHSDRFVTLLPDSLPAEEIVTVFSRIRVMIKNLYDLSVTVGISDSCTSYIDLMFYYEEACDAITIGRVPNSDGPIQLISNVRLEQAIYKSCATPYFQNYVNDTIGKLELYDREHRTDLTKTLDTFIENMGTHQKTAEKLFIHRNTLANRIRKIEKITGIDLSQNKNLYRFGFALKIRYYI